MSKAKTHYANGCHSLCGRVYVWQDSYHVSHVEIECVDDWKYVTCKRCLSKRGGAR